MGGKKKDKKKAGERKRPAAGAAAPNSAEETAGGETKQEGKRPAAGAAAPGAARDFEDAWSLYSAALTGWTSSAIALQRAAAEAALSWLEAWRKAVDMDTEVLKGASAYWEDKWLAACAESTKQHLRAAASAAAAQAGAIRDAQLESLREYNRQWARLFGL